MATEKIITFTKSSVSAPYERTLVLAPTGAALTISKIVGVCRGSSPSVDFTIRHDTDRSLTGTEVVTGGSTFTSETTGDIVTTFDSPSIGIDNWAWVEITVVTGTVDELFLQLFYD